MNDGIKKLAALLVALGFVLFLHGAVPFFAMPTLGQAVWTTGFAQSFLNDSLFSIYASNIGAPQPAAISFGLAGAWSTALFMKLGLHPADAYSAMAALWLSVAFVAAYKISRLFQVTSSLAILGSVFWLSMPVTWAHAGYSMLSIGIGLLPFYFLSALNLFLLRIDHGPQRAKSSALYIFTCVLAVFMDGYTFMMFAVGASILAVWAFVVFPDQRRRLALHALPTHVLGFGLAYLLFALFIGKSQFEPSQLNHFRGWGVDLTFLAIPTQGMHWLPDLLGWSVPRSGKDFFGDSSVWTTTFSIPLILAACWACWKVNEARKLAVGFFLILLFGLYMSLGPSLKLESMKPPGEKVGPLMAAEYAIAPTGSALLSSNLPGFKNMRASYRWLALGVFGGWLLLVLVAGQRRTAIPALVIITLVIAFNLPDLTKTWSNDKKHRESFLRIDSDLLESMREVIHKGEKVAFLPYRNDFLVNYLASRLGIVSYNIGGDKNLCEAKAHWPETMSHFRMGSIDEGFSDRVILLLARQEADAVVLPYIDMLWAAHRWPAPARFEEALQPVVLKLKESDFVEVDVHKYYAVVKLKPALAQSEQKGDLENRVLKDLCMPPSCLKRKQFSSESFSQVGDVVKGHLVANGRQGFLHFGPYRPMNEGRYQLIVRGTSIRSVTAWVDVVSSKGTVEHARFSVLPSRNQGPDILVEGFLTLESPVNDLEIRVFVGSQDVIQLEGYELMPWQE